MESHKGISPVIASIILVLIVITLGSAFLVFSGRLTQESTSAAEEETTRVRVLTSTTFLIDNIKNDRLFVRNTGAQAIELNSLRVSLDDEDAEYEQDGPIEPGKNGVLTITNLWSFGPGERTLRVAGVAHSVSKQVRVKPTVEGKALDINFDEGSGTTAQDASLESNDGVLTNGPVWTAGKSGNALEFDGTNDFVNVSSSESLSISDFITVEMWVKRDSTTNGYDGLLYKRQSEAGFAMILYDDADGGRAAFSTGSTESNSFSGIQGTTKIEAGKWYHIVGTYDTNVGRKIYVNGELDGSDSVTGKLADSSAVDLWIGRYGSVYHDGVIDYIAIYDRALTHDEVRLEYEMPFVMEEA